MAKVHAGTKYITQKPVVCLPIIKCGTMGCAGSCPLSVAEYGNTDGAEPVTCGICGKTNWVSRNVLPREQSVPFGVAEEEVSLAATPKEPGLLFSGYGKASEHPVISSSLCLLSVERANQPLFPVFSAEVTTPSPCPLRNVKIA